MAGGGVKLTENLVFNRTKCSVDTVTRLNLWGCDVEDITLCSKMPNLKVLALSVNNVKVLEPLMYCSNMEELYVRKNNIENLQQIEYLRPLKLLRTLWLDENPCVNTENYRLKVLAALPQLKMLDNRTVTAEELEKAANLSLEEAKKSDDIHNDDPTPPETGRSRKLSYSVHTDLDDDARLAVEPMMFQSSYGSLGATQPIPTPYVPTNQITQPINTNSPYGSFPGQNIALPDHNHPLMSMSMHSGLHSQPVMVEQQHSSRQHEHNRNQQIMQHQNAINELMSASMYQQPSSAQQPQTIMAGQPVHPMAQSMTTSVMRPSYQSLNNMQALAQHSQQQQQQQHNNDGNNDELCQSWPEFNFDDPPSLTPGRESQGSPDRMAPLNAPSTFLTQQQLSARKRYNRSRSISPSRNSANIIVAITNLLDELDMNGLRVVIDEAQRRIKKQR